MSWISLDLRKVTHFSRALNSLHNAEINDDPSDKQAESKIGFYAVGTVDSVAQLQYSPPEKKTQKESTKTKETSLHEEQLNRKCKIDIWRKQEGTCQLCWCLVSLLPVFCSRVLRGEVLRNLQVRGVCCRVVETFHLNWKRSITLTSRSGIKSHQADLLV